MTAVEVEYGVLGPLEARADGEPVTLGGRVQRALLAALLLHANEPVSTDRLVEAVWGEKPPATAEHSIQVYVSKLRKALGADSIVRTGSGYLLRVAPGRLDLERFESLTAMARQELATGDAERARGLLDEALTLWRGAPLADLELEDFAQSAIARLEELRVAAEAARVEALLALGRQGEAIPELERLTTANPHDERLRGLHMLALYRAGRQSEALAQYQAIRTRLAEDLGIEPSHSLRELERKVLSQDPSLERAEDAPDAAVRSVVVVPQGLEQLDELAVLTEPFGLSKNPHEVILAWIGPPGPADAVSASLAEASSHLARTRTALVARGARARVAAFTAEDLAEDTLRLARRADVDLLVLGRTLAELENGRFDAALVHVLCGAPCDVALWLKPDPSLADDGGPILVPFGAVDHDWAALELAAWIATTTERPLVLLGAAGDERAEQRDASRLLADAGLLVQRATGVVASPRLAAPGREGLLAAIADAGLVVAGLSDRWQAEGLGETRLELARSAPAPVLFLRRGLRPGGLSPPEGLTLYRWSVTVAA
jgi:DNA-binding SARP family transcriptional activator